MTTINNPVIIGGVYLVKDSAIRLPPDQEREPHAQRRPVVVLTGPNSNSNTGWPIVLAAPVSTSTTRKTSFCVKLAVGEGGVPKQCWVRVVAIQPLLKSDLGDRLGLLPAARLGEVQARRFQYMGLLDDDPV